MAFGYGIQISSPGYKIWCASQRMKVWGESSKANIIFQVKVMIQILDLTGMWKVKISPVGEWSGFQTLFGPY